MLRHIIDAARSMGLERLSLETGSWEYFNAARALYRRHGFVECPPFGDYVEDRNSIFMTLHVPPHVNFTVRMTDIPDEALRNGILGPLAAYNQAQTGRNDPRALIIALDDPEGRVIGGLWGRTAYDWLFVELLFVPEALRGHGIGSELMRRAEAEALARGCHSAWLDTFEFQARGFYESLGYTCFGELPDYPAGSARYFMKKALRARQA
jgi:GNAT superfamily N-acetyltransferase